MVHSGIDGYSRLIVYLQCSCNNRRDTVLTHFLVAVSLYGVPERIRMDRGGKNVQVKLKEWRVSLCIILLLRLQSICAINNPPILVGP